MFNRGRIEDEFNSYIIGSGGEEFMIYIYIYMIGIDEFCLNLGTMMREMRTI